MNDLGPGRLQFVAQSIVLALGDPEIWLVVKAQFSPGRADNSVLSCLRPSCGLG
jgi:hypothetical protein